MIKGLKKLTVGSDKHRSASRTEKSELAVTAPKRIVRALYPYTARSEDELSFNENDFLYIIDESDPEWYVASDPLKNRSGLVPISYFEIIQRQESAPAVSLSMALHAQVEQTPVVDSHASGSNIYDHVRSASRAVSSTSQVIKRSVSGNSHRSQNSVSISSPMSFSNGNANASGATAGNTGHGHQRNPSLSYSLNQGSHGHSRGPSVGSGAGSFDASSRRKHSNARGSLALYGFVLYDFAAERNDELNASAGESIVVIAQSNEEWFVAKPIGRLGGPGLIPVSYVELREVGTDRPIDDVADAIKRAGVPHVEEWKRRAAEYKASSIPLGRSDSRQGASKTKSPTASSSAIGHKPSGSIASQRSNSSSQRLHKQAPSLGSIKSNPAETHNGLNNSQHESVPFPVTTGGTYPDYASAALAGPSQPHLPREVRDSEAKDQSREDHPATYPSRAVGESGHAGTGGFSQSVATEATEGEHEGQKVYVVDASVDRVASVGQKYWYLVKAEMSDGSHRNLCRFYQDFYDYQIRLLDQFPAAAGRTGQVRTLPFLPGPMTMVNPQRSNNRRLNLDDYIRDLLRMPHNISRSDVCLELFTVRHGDVENPHGPVDEYPQPPAEYGSAGNVVSGMSRSESATNLAAIVPQALPQPSPRANHNHQSSQSTNKSANSNQSNQSNQSAQSAQSQPSHSHQSSQSSQSNQSNQSNPWNQSFQTNSSNISSQSLQAKMNYVHQSNQSEGSLKTNGYSRHARATSITTSEAAIATAAAAPSTSSSAYMRHGQTRIYGNSPVLNGTSPTIPSTTDFSAPPPSAASAAPSSAPSSATVTAAPVASSALTAPAAPSAPAAPPTTKEGTIKVKVYTPDDVIAIRVPAALGFADVYNRISQRLKLSRPVLYKTPEFAGQPIDSQESYENAVEGSHKVAFYACST